MLAVTANYSKSFGCAKPSEKPSTSESVNAWHSSFYSMKHNIFTSSIRVATKKLYLDADCRNYLLVRIFFLFGKPVKCAV